MTAISQNANLGAAGNAIDFDGGTLRIDGTALNSLSRAVTTTGAGTLRVADAAASVNLSGSLTGAGALTKDGDGRLTLSNAALYDGELTVGAGVLVVNNGSGLGTAVGGTAVEAAAGTIELNGGAAALAISEPITRLQGRTNDATPHLRSVAGNNTLTGAISVLGAAGTTGNLENAAQGTTLTINSTIADTFNEEVSVVFQGTGNFKIGNELTPGSGKIVGDNVDVIVRLTDPTDSVTIATAAASTDTTNATGSYWGGSTIVESGTLVMKSDGASNGELASSRIDVRAGARLDVSGFTTAGYSLQVVDDPDAVPFNGDEIGQVLTGGGQVITSAQGLRAFEDAVIAPGDGVGTLTITGGLTVNQSQANPNGALNYQLGSASTAGGGVNDLVAVSGGLGLLANGAAGGGQFKLNVTVEQDKLATTPYTLMTAGSTAGSTATSADFDITLRNTQGTTLNSRQGNGAAVSVNANSVTATFAAAQSRVWTGAADAKWDVDGAVNWSGGDGKFFDLDAVTFGQSGARNVTAVGPLTPSSTTFSPTTGAYTLTGGGGIQGNGPVNVNSGQVNLLNGGNNYSGATTVASGAKLTMATASTGGMVNNGTLNVGGTGMAGPNFRDRRPPAQLRRGAGHPRRRRLERLGPCWGAP